MKIPRITKKHTQQKKQWNHKKRVLVSVSTLALVTVMVAGIYVSAKYYAAGHSKGVAMASGLYFDSNLLKDITEEESQEIFNTDAWDGQQPYTFDLQIRNYQNQLLYNDSNLDIQFDITFTLMGTDDGGQYSVTNQAGNETEKTLTADSPITYSNVELKGGRALSDHFAVKVQAPSGADSSYQSQGIKVVAVPTSPEYVKDAYKIGGTLYAKVVSSQSSMSYGFDVESQLSAHEPWDSADAQRIDNLAGLSWTMNATAGENSASQNIVIKWNSQYVQMNQYDKYYIEAQKEGNVSGTQGGWMTMNLNVDAYSTINLVFYKTTQFHCATTESSTMITSKAQLHDLVTATQD